MTERDEQALRDALQQLGSDEPLDLGQVRRRAAERRRNARAVAGLAVALVVLAGVVGLPRLLAPGGDQPSSMAGGAQAEPESRTEADTRGAPPEAGTPPGGRAAATADAGPDGWRTEYFRDISFSVPSTWGYAVPPQSDWCADEPVEPRADQRRPYVWLDGDIPVLRVGCPGEPPVSLLTEHVEALSPGPDTVEGAVRRDDWWVVTRSAGQAALVVTTKDRALADRILDSIEVEPPNAPCSPESPVISVGARPSPPTDLSDLGDVDRVALCQYQTRGTRTPLRAARVVDGGAADDLVTALRSGPVGDSRPCDPVPPSGYPEIFVLVRVESAGKSREVYVSAVGCPGSSRGMVGGVDDGTTLRVLTRDACRQVLTPPLAIWAASGAVAENCLR